MAQIPAISVCLFTLMRTLSKKEQVAVSDKLVPIKEIVKKYAKDIIMTYKCACR